METEPRDAVAALVDQLNAGTLTGAKFAAAATSLPVVEQLPAAPGWTDGSPRADGPVRAVRLEAMTGLLSAEVAAATIRRMMDAGHQA